MTTQNQRRAWTGPAVLSYGFRPFFLGAACWAVLSVALWVAMLGGGAPLPIGLDPTSWHAHEFLFGYLGAVMAGFLLTAVPNWTGRLPVVGWPLAGLASLWALGRLALACGAALPASLVAAIDLAFPVALAVFLAREILAGRNWKNLVVLCILLVFLFGNILFHVEAATGGFAAQGRGLRLGLAAGVLLVAVIGGRIVPSFTRNWLVKAGREKLPVPPMQPFDRIALIGLVLALLGWVAMPEATLSGALMILAGLLHLIRMARWQGQQTFGEPLVWVLHLAYGFVPLGAFGLGGGILAQSTGLSVAGLHVWTVGALGMMTLAVMTRATLGHTGGALHAGPATTALYLLLGLSLVLRVIGSLVPEGGVLMTGSALFWGAAFLGFVGVYGPKLWRPRR